MVDPIEWSSRNSGHSFPASVAAARRAYVERYPPLTMTLPWRAPEGVVTVEAVLAPVNDEGPPLTCGSGEPVCTQLLRPKADVRRADGGDHAGQRVVDVQ